jgi:hypothetical protein
VAILLFVTLPMASTRAPAKEPSWKAGAAKVVITPDQPMWMSGYSGRTRPADGKINDLWAKALVLEDPAGSRVALVTLDLVGIDRDFSRGVRDAIRDQYGLTPDRCALLCSHTHSGPVVGQNLMAMYFLDAQQEQRVRDYTADLHEKIARLVGEAIDQLAPATIARGSGEAGFAVNRRNNPEAEVPRLLAEGKIRGPHDHEVPVLAVRGLDGTLRAVLFGYACHATVLDGYQWCGDYPGFAQAYLETSHPGSVALFFAGCGADQNPIPRRQVELAEKYGRELASAVDQVLAKNLRPVTGRLATSYSEVEIPFAEIPNREQLEQATRSDNRYEASRARLLLTRLQRDGSLSETYPYPVQVWRLGDVRLVTLGGEVVVDYALRLKHELGRATTWVAGYANDVMAYIPSRRVLAEGGYEGGGAMVYYGQPSAWTPEIEELIIRRVHQQDTQIFPR